MCLEGRPFDLEIALKNGSSDFLDITKAECKGLNCSLEAEYKTSAPAPLKMKIFGEILDNGYIEIEIDGKKDKYELVD
ncbi:hypothetical protein LEP1GSC133_4546 [Leptospira borgpetersenii serovar Pomona str. 200901868]|uniref:Uncharacterized protein n=1 Tax=Leptospira borgpetersenii serovar Pomona str. 200901868 TaxID=1192866 RepID=M6W337_LEPBO|nr:hypothetical protein LEP1GSC133_4546 [Leptospira borgpetersenii serovar Pomona str. 200901868]